MQRLYREERLTVRRRGGRKRAMGTRRPMATPLAPNQRWSLDFVSDQLTDGRRFRILAVVDDCTRECLALVADTSISGRRVARELDDIIAPARASAMIVSDNGTELTSQRHPELGGRDRRRLALHRARQAAAERLHRELQRPPARRAAQRDAVPIAAAARAVLEAWRRDYNEERPHSKLGWMTPRGYASALSGETGRDAALRGAPRPGLLPPRKQKVKSTPDSCSDWMKNRGHVTQQINTEIDSYHVVKEAQDRLKPNPGSPPGGCLIPPSTTARRRFCVNRGVMS